MSRKPKRSNSGLTVVLILLILVMIAATALLIWLSFDLVNKDPAPSISQNPSVTVPSSTRPTETEPTTEPPETTLPVPEHVVSTATVGAMGDLLMHKPIFGSEYSAECYQNGNYNFESVFEYLTEYSSAVDYAAVNLETTLYGPGREYRGYPMFNCPDDIVTAAVDAGFDMMLTANNHSYDTGIDGYNRTLQVCRDAGMTTLGTMLSGEEPKYEIVDVNGIKIGMLCYTYETSDGSGAYPSLNGNPMYDGSYDVVNCFVPSAPQRMYSEIEQYLAEMEAAGAEATMVYIHWGVEYQTYANDNQKAIAQKLCDLGVDVIIGGHPHVVQPVDLLESTVDPEHKTVIIYSLGNAVSNQRTGNISSAPAGYTEDGVLFSVTFEKYSDGTVYLAGADVLPTWVNKFTNENGRTEFNILPLDDSQMEQWGTLFNIGGQTLSAAQNSYHRTMGLVEEGLTECTTWLDQCKLDREEYYYNLAFFPEMFATEPTQATEATLPTQETIPAQTSADPA